MNITNQSAAELRDPYFLFRTIGKGNSIQSVVRQVMSHTYQFGLQNAEPIVTDPKDQGWKVSPIGGILA
jgi:hypothetical protein